MSARVAYTALYEQVENGWTQARIAELPGVITAAPTLEDAKELLVDALREYLLALQEGASGAVDQPSTDGSDFRRGVEGRVDLVIEAA